MPTIELKPYCKSRAVQDLHAELLTQLNADVEFDCSDLDFIPTLIMQTIISFQISRKELSASTRLINQSDQCKESMALLGIKDEIFA